MPFGNSRRESQRDSVSKLRVGGPNPFGIAGTQLFPASPLTSFQPGRGKIHELAGLGVFAGSRHHFVQLPARLGIRFHLPVPIVVRLGMKQCLQLATLLRRELFYRPLDLSNRAHGTNLSVTHSGVNLMPAGAAIQVLQHLSAVSRKRRPRTNRPARTARKPRHATQPRRWRRRSER